LIAASAGYWVLTHASKERGRVKRLGQWLGMIIIVVSLCGAAFKLYLFSACWGQGKAFISCTGGKACPLLNKPCPMQGQSASTAP
jgi:hypothetical protein